MKVVLITPKDALSSMMQLFHDHEGDVKETEGLLDGRIELTVEMPLRELMRGFFDKVKNVSSGYASLSYEYLDDRSADVVKLEIYVAEEAVPAFARVISRRRVVEEGERMVERLHQILPKQLFVVKIQAHALGRIVASRSISAMRKDVTGYLYGGDITRKMKLLEKQKKGKKRRGEHAKMDIPQGRVHENGAGQRSLKGAASLLYWGNAATPSDHDPSPARHCRRARRPSSYGSSSWISASSRKSSSPARR